LKVSWFYVNVKSMKKIRKPVIKMVELRKPTSNKHGYIKYNEKEPLPHEKRTIECLSSYGFDVETIIPSNIPGSKNPDILMMGTFWEIKGPTNANDDTIEKRFHKAIKQSGGKAIFDLRNIDNKKDRIRAKDNLLKLFGTNRGMRRIIIIESGTKVLDFYKK